MKQAKNFAEVKRMLGDALKSDVVVGITFGDKLVTVRKSPLSNADRMKKYHEEHKDKVNARKRELYTERKSAGLCVRCGAKALKRTLMCGRHTEV